MSEKVTTMTYTLHRAEGGIVEINADTFGLGEGWIMFMQRGFSKEFGMILSTIAAYRVEDVKFVEGIFDQVQQRKPGLDLVTN